MVGSETMPQTSDADPGLNGLSVNEVRQFDQTVVEEIAAQVTAALDQHREFISGMLVDIVGEFLRGKTRPSPRCARKWKSLKADLLIQRQITSQLSADVAAAEMIHSRRRRTIGRGAHQSVNLSTVDKDPRREKSRWKKPKRAGGFHEA